MKKHIYAMAVVVGAVVVAALVSGCSGGSQEAASPTGVTTGTAAPMPSSATFIADTHERDGQMMTMAISVEGQKVIAYATNGRNEEAYFFGNEDDGKMNLMSMYGDYLKASFDGKDVAGQVTMNETGPTPVTFTASSVAAPAGLYTAGHDNVRASWVVRPDHTMTGVMDNSAPGDHKLTDAIMANDQAFKDRVRQMRLDRQLQQAPRMTYGSWSMRMGGSTVTAVRVTGDMSF